MLTDFGLANDDPQEHKQPHEIRNMKLCSISYLPHPDFTCARTYVANLQKFPRAFPLLTYTGCSDLWPAIDDKEERVKLRAMPDYLRDVHKFAVNNMAFYTGLRVAAAHGYSHVIYLEADCRVGRERWDEVMFEEFFNLGRPVIAAGTLACYNPCNYSQLAGYRWEQLIAMNSRKNFPIATYGWLPAGTRGNTCLYPNGALSVLDIQWMGQLFDLEQTEMLARAEMAWDMAIGVQTWNRFQEASFDMLGYLKSVFSGYADLLTSEEQRLDMLRSGKIVAVHQIKSDATV